LSADPKDRIATLDLIRGVAVLGIVAVNIAGFAGPAAATLTPNLPHPASAWDEATFAAIFVLFEGKMRALFTLLFGASMLLFIERVDAKTGYGEALQIRRLGWLALFGYLHFALLWWGDILFTYALCGFVALALRGFSTRMLLAMGLMVFTLTSVYGALHGWPLVLAEEHLRLGTATPAQAAKVTQALATMRQNMAQDIAQAHLGFWPMIADKLAQNAFWPLIVTISSFGETLPLMLIGMALYRSGLPSGHWPRPRLWAMAILGLGLGGIMALALAQWAWARHFPPLAMPDLMAYWAQGEHLLMALGLYAALVLAAPRLLSTTLGQSLSAAGRMAFTNYLGTSAIMCAIFYGWGLNLFGQVSHTQQIAFILAQWTLMLAWSRPWLTHFRQGPLEWAWRSLVEARRMPFKF